VSKQGVHLLLLTAIAALAFLASMASNASAAAPVVNEHTGPVTDSFPDELCGIAGTSATRFVGNFKLYADGTFLSTGNFDQTFTADATGNQVLISGVEQVTGPFNPTDNGNGTIGETFTFKGLPMKVKIPNGPTLVRDAGNETEVITFVLNPDGTRGDFLSDTVVVEHGPHPQLDNDALFCDVVTAALT
jgi:hypothetical protein